MTQNKAIERNVLSSVASSIKASGQKERYVLFSINKKARLKLESSFGEQRKRLNRTQYFILSQIYSPKYLNANISQIILPTKCFVIQISFVYLLTPSIRLVRLAIRYN